MKKIIKILPAFFLVQLNFRISVDEAIFNQFTGSGSGDRWFPLDAEAIEAIWMPKLDIENIKEIMPVASMQNQQKIHVELTRDRNQRFYHEMHAGVTINCPMDFTKFPFDSHACYFEVRSAVFVPFEENPDVCCSFLTSYDNRRRPERRAYSLIHQRTIIGPGTISYRMASFHNSTVVILSTTDKQNT